MYGKGKLIWNRYTDRYAPLTPSVKLAWLFLLFAGCVISIGAFVFRAPGIGLDPAWNLGLNYAIAHGWQFGRDIVFTFGPYAPAYTRLYDPGVFSIALYGNLLISVAMSIALISIVQSQRFFAYKLLGFLLVLALLCSAGLHDWYIVLPLIVFFAILNISDRSWISISTLVVSVAALSVLSLVKGTFAIASVGVLIILLFANVPRYAKVASWAVYLVGILVFWGLAGQHYENLLPFVIFMAHVTSGYSEAMSASGHKPLLAMLEILLFAIISGGLAWACFRKKVSNLPVTLAVLLILFTGFKAGFVRHDGHAAIAAGVLMLCAYLVFLLARSRLAIAGMIVSVVYFGFIVQGYQHVNGIDQVKREAGYLGGSIGQANLILWHGTKHLERRYQTAIDEIRNSYPISGIDGDVDIYSFRQDLLLANGLSWHPRPVFQGFAAYNEALGELNAEHLMADGAPKNILFKLETIDGRLLALDDAKSWPLILSAYAPERIIGGYVHFVRKAEPSPYALKPLKTITSHFGDEIHIPDSNQLIWVEVDMRPNLFGRLVNTLYKLPRLLIETKLANNPGKPFDSRYIASEGRAGFLISPMVENELDFLGLVDPGDLVHSQRVASMRIFSRFKFAGWLYSSDVPVHFYELDLQKQDLDVNDPELARLQRLRNLKGNHRIKMIDAGGRSVLGAHAPSEFMVKANPLFTKATLCFGIRDGAWQGNGKTDGVEFELEFHPSNASHGVVLWKRFLDPLHQAKDRGEQCHEVALKGADSSGEGDYYLKTSIGSTPDWDWAYWSDVHFE